MTTTEPITPPKTEARSSVGVGFKVILWWGVCALLGQPLHLLSDRTAELWTVVWIIVWLSVTGFIIVLHVVVRGLPVPKWMQKSHGVVVDTAQQDPLCMECGYDLRTLTSERCPECGWVIDRSVLGRSLLSWPHRDRIGASAAFWRTAWMATRRPKRLAMEVVRPVDPRQAKKFATIVSLLAGVPLALVVIALMVSEGRNIVNQARDPGRWGYMNTFEYAEALVPYAAGLTLWGVAPLGLVLSFWLITRSSATWFAHGEASAERKRSGAALSHYAMAPLAWTPVLVALFALGAGTAAANPRDTLVEIWWIVAAISGGGVAICWFLSWMNLLVLLWRANQASELWLLTVALMLPVTWAVCVVIGLGVMPWIVGYVWLIFDSLR